MILSNTDRRPQFWRLCTCVFKNTMLIRGLSISGSMGWFRWGQWCRPSWCLHCDRHHEFVGFRLFPSALGLTAPPDGLPSSTEVEDITEAHQLIGVHFGGKSGIITSMGVHVALSQLLVLRSSHLSTCHGEAENREAIFRASLKHEWWSCVHGQRYQENKAGGWA